MKTLIAIFLILQTAYGQQSAKDEVQAYLDKVKAGQAGQNPQDVTQARSGDPYAQARVRLRTAINNINAANLSPEVAEIRRASAQASYDRELMSIEQTEALRRMQQQQELDNQRLRQELQRRRIEAEYRNRAR